MEGIINEIRNKGLANSNRPEYSGSETLFDRIKKQGQSNV